MSARKRPPKSKAPTSAADAAQRLAAIVQAAEEAASTVIDDAEEQARRTLEEADARADRAIADRLRALADELDPPEEAKGKRRAHLKPLDSIPEPDGEGPEPALMRRSGSAGARLLATQMAVSGASREEIEERLQGGFEIEDAGEILDAILGPED